MEEMEIFISNWVKISVDTFFTFSTILFIFLIIILIVPFVDRLFIKNQRKNLLRGYGGFFITRGWTFGLFLYLAYYLYGGILLAPVLSFIRRLLTDQLFPIIYYYLLALIFLIILFSYIIEPQIKKFVQRGNYYLIHNNILIMKFNAMYAYIPLSGIKVVQTDSENLCLKFIFKTKILFFSLTPRWVFEFKRMENYNEIIDDLRPFNIPFEETNIKKRFLTPKIAMEKKEDYHEASNSFPTEIKLILF